MLSLSLVVVPRCVTAGVRLHYRRRQLIRSFVSLPLSLGRSLEQTEIITVSVALWVSRQEMLDDVLPPSQPEVMKRKQHCTAAFPAWQF